MTSYKKHMEMQDYLKVIYTRAMEEVPKAGVSANLMCVMTISKPDKNMNNVVSEVSILRRGYKINYTVKTGMYELFTTTSSDYYKYVTETTIKEFIKKGFIRTVDEHQIKRYESRIEALKAKINDDNIERNDSWMVHWKQQITEIREKIDSIQGIFK